MSVTSTFWYLEDLPLYRHTKPYVVNLPLSRIPEGQRTNQICSPHPNIEVKDIRAYEKSLTLDKNGFALTTSIPMTLHYDEFRDVRKVKDLYCEKVREALLSMTNAESARVIHQAIRRRHTTFPEKPRGSAEAETDQPVQGVHCGKSIHRAAVPNIFDSEGRDMDVIYSIKMSDYTPMQAYATVRSALGIDNAKMIWNERRVEIIQVWRPLRGPVVDWPLAVCDYTTVDKDSDLVATDNVWSYTVSETYNCLQRPTHAWYYVSNQTSDEVLLFKGFDNKRGVSTFCAHAAFELERLEDASRMRESIECAVLLIYPKKEQ